jgi:hypothetical protein
MKLLSPTLSSLYSSPDFLWKNIKKRREVEKKAEIKN